MPEQISPQQENHYTGSNLTTIGNKPFELSRFDVFQRANRAEKETKDTGLDFVYDSLKDRDEVADAYDRFQAEMADSVEAIREDWITRSGDINPAGMGPDEYVGEVTKAKMIDFLNNEFGEDNDEIDTDGIKTIDKKQAMSLVLRLTPQEKAALDEKWPGQDIYDKSLYGAHDTAASVPELPNLNRAKDNEEVWVYETNTTDGAEQRPVVADVDSDTDEIEYHEPLEVDTRRVEIIIPKPGTILRSVISRVRETLPSLSLDNLAYATGMGVATIMNAATRTAARLQTEAQLDDGSTERRWNKKRLVTASVMGGVALAAAVIASKHGFQFGSNSSAHAEAMNGAGDSLGQLPPIDTEPTPVSAAEHVISAHSPLNETGASSAADVIPTSLNHTSPVEIIDYQQFSISKGMGGESFAKHMGEGSDFWYKNERAFHKAFPELTFKMSDGHYGFRKAGELPEKAAKWWTTRISK